jgi:hypothetical protein
MGPDEREEAPEHDDFEDEDEGAPPPRHRETPVEESSDGY